MNGRNKPQISRRNATKMMLLSPLALSMPFVVIPSRTASKRIIVCDAGGSASQAYKEVFYQPFTQATGIKVVSVPADPTTPVAKIQTMVDTKRIMWDMAAIPIRDVLRLTTSGVYLEQHGLEHDPIVTSIAPQFRLPYGVGTNVYSTLLAYRTEAFKGVRVPESWQDFWDMDHFPGRRSLRKYPCETIEEALMADGVLPRNVYPCDLDRAFLNLAKIKPHVSVWWASGPQTEQLLKSGEVDLASVWSGRARSAINASAPFAISWNQHLYNCMCWAILKGTPNADACRQFIQFASDPKRQALLAPYGSGPTHPDAFKYIDSKHAKLLPTYPDNLKKGLLIDATYWLKHQQAATERFNHWLVS